MQARVLVIDDEPLVCRTLSRILSPHIVCEANTAEEGIALCLQEDFDIILCDLLLPDKNGDEIYKEIQIKQPGLEKRFVFMTGNTFSDRARDFLTAIKNPYFEKPFNINRIKLLVASYHKIYNKM